jgi:Flp pilus assembly pilin Flp
MLVLVEHFLSSVGIRLVDEDGQGLIEYVLIAALMSIAALGALTLLGPQVASQFTAVDAALP